MKLYIPETINLDELVKKIPSVKIDHKDRIAYILHLISEIPVRNRMALHNGFTLINAKTIQKVVRNYNVYIDLLIAEKILVCDNFYLPGEKSYGYKFSNPSYYKLIEYTATNKKIIRKEKHVQFLAYQCPWLSKWFNPRLKINFGLSMIDSNYSELLRTGEEKYPFNSINFAIKEINSGNFFFIRDKTSGRIHNSISNFKSEYRKYLSYDGKPLRSIDMVSSQAYLSTILFNDSFYKNEDSDFSLKNLYPELYNKIKNHPSLPSLMVTHSSSIKKFNELVIFGEFYEFLIGEARKLHHTLDRKMAKEAFFQVLFSSNRFIGQKEAWMKKIFQSLFPEVYKVYTVLKQFNKGDLAILLQRLESKLVIDKILRRISIEAPTVPIFSIHDCAVTTEGNEEYVDHVIKEECAKVIGAPPMTKIEKWVDSHDSITNHEFLLDSRLNTWLDSPGLKNSKLCYHS